MVRNKRAKTARGHSKDPVEVLLRITCNYPWSPNQLLALHALKYDVAAAAFRFYSNVSKAKADPAIKDILRKWLDGIE